MSGARLDGMGNSRLSESEEKGEEEEEEGGIGLP